MARIEAARRGIWERVPGSGVWWIRCRSSIMTACKGNQCRYLLCAMFGRIAEVWATADGFRSNSSSEIGNR